MKDYFFNRWLTGLLLTLLLWGPLSYALGASRVHILHGPTTAEAQLAEALIHFIHGAAITADSITKPISNQ